MPLSTTVALSLAANNEGGIPIQAAPSPPTLKCIGVVTSQMFFILVMVISVVCERVLLKV